MRSMPEASGQNEPNPSGHAEENQGFSGDILVWFVRLWAAAWILAVLWYLWQSEGMRLQLLHSGTRFLQNIAKEVGIWALLTEQAYNETAESLH